MSQHCTNKFNRIYVPKIEAGDITLLIMWLSPRVVQVNPACRVDPDIDGIVRISSQRPAVIIFRVGEAVMIRPLYASTRIKPRDLVVSLPDSDMFVVGRKIQHCGDLPKQRWDSRLPVWPAQSAVGREPQL